MTTTTLERPVSVGIPDEESPPEQPAPKRLSEVLRTGARLHPQGRGALYRAGKTCALGAILVGLVGPEHVERRGVDYDLVTTLVLQQTDVNLEHHVRMPSCRMETPLWGAIIGLNDTDGWTREQIADWLEGMGL